MEESRYIRSDLTTSWEQLSVLTWRTAGWHDWTITSISSRRTSESRNERLVDGSLMGGRDLCGAEATEKIEYSQEQSFYTRLMSSFK